MTSRGAWRIAVIKNGGEKPCDCVCSITTDDNKNGWDKMLHRYDYFSFIFSVVS